MRGVAISNQKYFCKEYIDPEVLVARGTARVEGRVSTCCGLDSWHGKNSINGIVAHILVAGGRGLAVGMGSSDHFSHIKGGKNPGGVAVPNIFISIEADNSLIPQCFPFSDFSNKISVEGRSRLIIIVIFLSYGA
jgi:hypothetical protein